MRPLESWKPRFFFFVSAGPDQAKVGGLEVGWAENRAQSYPQFPAVSPEPGCANSARSRAEKFSSTLSPQRRSGSEGRQPVGNRVPWRDCMSGQKEFFVLIRSFHGPLKSYQRFIQGFCATCSRACSNIALLKRGCGGG